MVDTPWHTFDQFSGRVGQSFVIASPAGDVLTELVEAVESGEPGGRGPEGQDRLQFSLVFRGPVEPLLPQATYAVAHDELGSLELFLVPIGPDGSGMRYQAVFA